VTRIAYFGFKKSEPPTDATLVVDCRMLWTEDTEHPIAATLLALAEDHARQTPNAYVVFGCDMGQVRSRALAYELARRLAA
jgi:RNase adaptor protein for sRNA GlmZ degradation